MPKVYVDGDKALKRKLARLRKGFRADVAVEMVEAAMAPLRDMAEILAPRDTGALAEGMLAEIDSVKAFQVDGIVGPDKDEFYGLFHEYVWEGVHHSANPFMRPAFDAEKGRMVKEAADVARRRLHVGGI